MIHQILHKTADTLQEIFLAGTAIAHQHSGLLSHIAALEPLAAKVPAFARLRQELTDLSNSTAEHASIHLLQVQSLVSAILYTQTQTSSDDPLETLPEFPAIDFQHHLLPVGLRSLQTVMVIEETNHVSKLGSMVQSLANQNLFQDWRTFPAIKFLLGKQWNDDFYAQCIYKTIPQQSGQSFRNYFYHSPIDPDSIAQHIQYLMQDNDPHALVWGKTVLEDPSLSKTQINMASAVATLGFAKENEAEVLEYTQHKKLEVRLGAYRALLLMQSAHATELLIAELVRTTKLEEVQKIGVVFGQLVGTLNADEQATLVTMIQTLSQSIIREKLSQAKKIEHNMQVLFKIYYCLEALDGVEALELLPVLEDLLKPKGYIADFDYEVELAERILAWYLSNPNLSRQYLPQIFKYYDVGVLLYYANRLFCSPDYPLLHSLTADDIFEIFSPYLKSINWSKHRDESEYACFFRQLVNKNLFDPWRVTFFEALETSYQNDGALAFELLKQWIYWVDNSHPLQPEIETWVLKTMGKFPHFYLANNRFDLFEIYLTRPENTKIFLQNQQAFLKLLPNFFQTVLSQIEALKGKPYQYKKWEVVADQLGILQATLGNFLTATEAGHVEIPMDIHAQLTPEVQKFIDPLALFEQEIYDRFKTEGHYHDPAEVMRSILHFVYCNPKLATSSETYLERISKGFLALLDSLEEHQYTAYSTNHDSIWLRLEAEFQWLARALGNIKQLSVPVSSAFLQSLTEQVSRFEQLNEHFKTFDSKIHLQTSELLRNLHKVLPSAV